MLDFNNSVPEGMKGAVPAHIRGDAIDLRIRHIDGQSYNYKQIETFVNKLGLIYDPRALPSSYPDQHHHIQVPRGKDIYKLVDN